MSNLEIAIPLPVDASADVLNRSCFCRTLDKNRLRKSLESDPSIAGMMQTRLQLFSSTVVFIADEIARKIAAIVAAIGRVAALPTYQTIALSRAPAVAQRAFGPVGACMGFDFHLGADGPHLIEINTNAGGALINAALARAQQSCCEAMDWAFSGNARAVSIEQTLFEMFIAEWRLQRADICLRSVLIVDDDPASQYLAPEFTLFQQMFRHHGVVAHIAAAIDVEWRDNKLWHKGEQVDMVYNRLTDFYLEERAHRALRSAYEAGAVVLTPHPHAHALHADKRNLIIFGQDDLLRGWGVSADDRALLLAGVPYTRLVTADRADELWAQRRQLFFKPAKGFGARAAYRGDKLTRRVWGEILAGDFVAQALVPPGERLIEVNGIRTALKFDLRTYTYNNTIQLFAARMYTGQTTNFRTKGGGFAPVVVIPPHARDTHARNCPAAATHHV